MIATLAKNEGVCESSPTRSDMDRTTTSEIKRGEIVEPAVGIPCPASDGAVDDGAPEEGENKRRYNTATLERSTDHDLDGASGEEQLVQTEDDFRDVDRARRRSCDDVLHAKVGQITNEGIGSARVGKRVAPEHPLECHSGLMSVNCPVVQRRVMKNIHSDNH